MDRALGCDISHWQGNVDFNRMHDAGARFVILKASQATWTDNKFVKNYHAARQVGLLIGMYHYLDWSVPAVQQARYFAKLVTDYPPDIEPVIDFEERKNAPGRLAAVSALNIFVQTIEDLTSRVSMIYTSPGYWRDYGDTWEGWTKYPLWIANYKVAKPVVPKPFSDWLFWQYTDRGDGARYGVSSAQIDLNWFNGTAEQLYERYKTGVVVTQPLQAIRLQVVVPMLNIRQGAAISFARIGELRQESQVVIEAIKVENARRVWAKHSAGWSAIVYDDHVFMQEVMDA